MKDAKSCVLDRVPFTLYLDRMELVGLQILSEQNHHFDPHIEAREAIADRILKKVEAGMLCASEPN